MRHLALAAALVLLSTSPVSAAVERRFALVIGNNAGGVDAVRLHYAESDADKLAEVLQQLGGFAGNDVRILLGATADGVRTALTGLEQRIAGAGDGVHTTLLVYYSGHARDGDLRLGASRLPMAELRQRLTTSGADIRLGLIDACEAGAITREKGGRPGPSFLFDSHQLQPSTGLILITSSTEDESSQESDELGGSFFTHYLTSGLRGDADESGDRRVTLEEIYRYTYNRTVAQTAGTRSGVQHPTYHFDLKGNGSLVLTDLSIGGTGIVFGAPIAGHFLIFDMGREQVAAEVKKVAGARRRIALPPGKYVIKKRLADRLLMARFGLAEGKLHDVDESAMQSVAFEDDYAKGAVLKARLFADRPVRPALKASAAYQVFLSKQTRDLLFPPLMLIGLGLELDPIFSGRMMFDVLVGGAGQQTLDYSGLSLQYDFFELQLAIAWLWGFDEPSWSLMAGPKLAGLYLSRTFPDDPDLVSYAQDHFGLSPAIDVLFRYAFGDDGGFVLSARGGVGFMMFSVDDNRPTFYTQLGLSAGYEF